MSKNEPKSGSPAALEREPVVGTCGTYPAEDADVVTFDDAEEVDVTDIEDDCLETELCDVPAEDEEHA